MFDSVIVFNIRVGTVAGLDSEQCGGEEETEVPGSQASQSGVINFTSSPGSKHSIPAQGR